MQAAVRVGAEMQLDQRDRRGVIAALEVGAPERELRAGVAGVDRRGPLQQGQGFVEPSQLQLGVPASFTRRGSSGRARSSGVTVARASS